MILLHKVTFSKIKLTFIAMYNLILLSCNFVYSIYYKNILKKNLQLASHKVLDNIFPN